MFLDIVKVLILSLVEGLTEFIPVSSTGHMIIMEHFLKLSKNTNFVSAFQIIIQLGAILSVVVYFWDRIYPFSKRISESKKKDIIEMWIKIVVAVLPAVILGLLLDDIIEKEEKLIEVKKQEMMNEQHVIAEDLKAKEKELEKKQKKLE